MALRTGVKLRPRGASFAMFLTYRSGMPDVAQVSDSGRTLRYHMRAATLRRADSKNKSGDTARPFLACV
jgi:hypothetical protein